VRLDEQGKAALEALLEDVQATNGTNLEAGLVAALACVCEGVGWLVGWWVGLCVCCLCVGCLFVGWLVGLFVCLLVGWLVGLFVC
jgi:hypothetical protein